MPSAVFWYLERVLKTSEGGSLAGEIWYLDETINKKPRRGQGLQFFLMLSGSLVDGIRGVESLFGAHLPVPTPETRSLQLRLFVALAGPCLLLAPVNDWLYPAACRALGPLDKELRLNPGSWASMEPCIRLMQNAGNLGLFKNLTRALVTPQ